MARSLLRCSAFCLRVLKKPFILADRPSSLGLLYGASKVETRWLRMVMDEWSVLKGTVFRPIEGAIWRDQLVPLLHRPIFITYAYINILFRLKKLLLRHSASKRLFFHIFYAPLGHLLMMPPTPHSSLSFL